MFSRVQRHVEAFVKEHGRDDIDTERVICLDATNRWIDGYCYLLGGAAGFPQLAVKAARTSEGKAVYEIEFETLQRLQRLGMNAERRRTPEPLGLHHDRDLLITLQSALPGTLMKNIPGKRLFSASTVDETIDRVLPLWAEFQQRVGTKPVELTEDVYEEQVLAHVVRFTNRYLLDPDERAFLTRRFEQLRPLLGLRLPLMVRHGDFCTANMVLDDDDIGVFDWEFPLTHQMPLFDLLYFFSSVRFPYAGYRGESGHFDSFVEVYWGESYFSRAMRRAVRAACSKFDVPLEAVPDLLLLSLIQTANMKYTALVASHRFDYEELEGDAATDEEKIRRFESFRDADRDEPLACIRQGRMMGLDVFCGRGFPSF